MTIINVQPEQVSMKIIKDIYTDDLGTTINYQTEIIYLPDNSIRGFGRKKNELDSVSTALDCINRRLNAALFVNRVPEKNLEKLTREDDGF